jgi:hypothetical protein
MPELGTYGSVGAPGERSPGATWQGSRVPKRSVVGGTESPAIGHLYDGPTPLTLR